MTLEGSTVVGSQQNTLDHASLRRVLGHFCTGVAVITGHDVRGGYGAFTPAVQA